MSISATGQESGRTNPVLVKPWSFVHLLSLFIPRQSRITPEDNNCHVIISTPIPKKSMVNTRYHWARYVSEAVCAIDPNKNILYVNSAFEKLFAVSSGSFLHIVSESCQVDIRAVLEGSLHSPIELTMCPCLTVIDGKVKSTLFDWLVCSSDAANGEIVLIGRCVYFNLFSFHETNLCIYVYYCRLSPLPSQIDEEACVKRDALVDSVWMRFLSRVGLDKSKKEFILLQSQTNHLKQRIELMQMQVEEKKKRSEEKVMLVNRAFTRTIMHQLRSPLFCLSASLTTASLEEHLTSCETMTDTLNNLVLYDDALHPLNRQGYVSFNALNLLIDVVNGLATQARLAEVNLIIHPCNQEKAYVVMNTSKTRQALRNVIIDAIKFTPRSGITTVRAIVLKDIFRVEISNSGHAIDVTVLLSSTFMQFDPSVLEGIHGSSLGMHVAKNVIESHGGRFGAYSTLDPPITTFFLELPLSNEEVHKDDILQNTAIETIPISKKMITVLVVDDAPLCRKLIIRSLVLHCQSCIEASNGLEAYELVCTSLQNGHPYDYIFMDNSMPIMSGIESIRLIRTAGFRGKILMVTGNALADDIDDAFSSGADGVLIKPLKPADFESIIDGTDHLLPTFT